MTGAPFFHRQLQTVGGWLFSIYHDIRVTGVEHIPSSGPAIVAANHPTYLDAAFLMVGVDRPIRFMAWDRPFRIPLLGALLRAYGAIPVDMKKPGRASFEAAVKVLRGGEVFGIFPEGGRTRGLRSMNPFKSGVARLALITGAPIIPATIIGGRRVWRRGDLLPKPGPIEVHFHPAISIPAEDRVRWRRDRDLERGIIAEIIATIHRKLLPAMRKEDRLNRLLESAPQRLALEVEGIPCAFLVLCLLLLPRAAWPELAVPAAAWVAGYLSFLGLELLAEARGWWVKWFRHLLPWLTLAGIVHYQTGFPPVLYLAGELTFVAGLLWCTIFRFSLYRRVRTLLLVVAYATWLLQVLTWGII